MWGDGLLTTCHPRRAACGKLPPEREIRDALAIRPSPATAGGTRLLSANHSGAASANPARRPVTGPQCTRDGM